MRECVCVRACARRPVPANRRRGHAPSRLAIGRAMFPMHFFARLECTRRPSLRSGYAPLVGPFPPSNPRGASPIHRDRVPRSVPNFLHSRARAPVRFVIYRSFVVRLSHSQLFRTARLPDKRDFPIAVALDDRDLKIATASGCHVIISNGRHVKWVSGLETDRHRRDRLT